LVIFYLLYLANMKKIFLFIVIFVLGGVAYAYLNPLLLTFLQKEDTEVSTQNIPTPQTQLETKVIPAVEKKEESKNDTVTIAPDGSQLDGPFPIFDAEGNKTDATAQIVRSPEETLVQFENIGRRYPSTAVIYFSEEKQPEEYLNLGSVKFADGVFVYGIPLDADLSKYTYILLYDMEKRQVLSYATIK